MGLLQCPLPCQSCNKHKHKHKHSQSQSQHSINGLHSESSSTSASLSSQPSLPSVPSLTTQHSLTQQTIHHHCLATLKNSSSLSTSVSSLNLHGKFLYAGYSDSHIRAWNRDPSVNSSSNHDSFMVATSQGAVKSLVAVGNLLFSAHQDHKIRVWKINDDNPNKDYSYDLVAILPTLHDRFLRFFTAKNYVQVRRHKKCTWVHHVDTVSALAVSNDKSLLYSASWDRSFKIWRTSDFRCLESVGNAHDDAINSIGLSNDGFLYTGSADKKIKVWKRHVGEKKHTLIDTLERHKSAVNALALSSDGCVLYSGACDRSILVWEKDVGAGGGGHMVVVGALRGHSKAILCLSVVNDLVCSGSADNTVRVWRGGAEKKYSCLAIFEGHRRPVKCLSVAVDNNSDRGGGGFDSSGSSYLVYSGSLDGDIRIWHIWIPCISLVA